MFFFQSFSIQSIAAFNDLNPEKQLKGGTHQDEYQNTGAKSGTVADNGCEEQKKQCYISCYWDGHVVPLCYLLIGRNPDNRFDG